MSSMASTLQESMSGFKHDEVVYLQGERRLARVATVGSDGNRTSCRSEAGATTKSWKRSMLAAAILSGRSGSVTSPVPIVVDDLASTDPWHPRAVEVRGRAEAIHGEKVLVRIHPDHVASSGLE